MLGTIFSRRLQCSSEGTVRIFGAGHNMPLVEMRMHVDQGRPDMTRSDINGRQAGECGPVCRLDRRDPVIVDEEVDKRRAVAIESRPWPVGQEAGRNAGLPDAITLCFWYLERLERVHSAWRHCLGSAGILQRYAKSIAQQMLATKGLTGGSAAHRVVAVLTCCGACVAVR